MADIPHERLSGYLDPNLIDTDIRAASKEEALRDLLNRMEANGRIKSADDLLVAFLNREKMMTTGIGNGLAVPHIHTSLVEEFCMAFGHCRQGIDYDALDGEPVYLIFMIAAVEETSRKHVRLVSTLMRLLVMPGVLDAIREAETPEGIIKVFRNAEGLE
ncbi:MAG: PTS sugar transporter subunit IIA [Planctomycetota bacterium]|nr:PTS sugar transporter subunit IIA [Planctomycetota bacterium]MDA1140744.1 PTS sugar transporter subunit IIA [Planctomycetota bacterium]